MEFSTEELTYYMAEEHIGLWAEFLAYMELESMPGPRRLFFEYAIYAASGALAGEIDLLLLLPGGLFVIEVKNRLKQTNKITQANANRIQLLRQRLQLHAGEPVYSVVTYHENRPDLLVRRDGNQAMIAQSRFLRQVVELLAEQHPNAIGEERMEDICDALQKQLKKPKKK